MQNLFYSSFIPTHLVTLLSLSYPFLSCGQVAAVIPLTSLCYHLRSDFRSVHSFRLILMLLTILH